MTHEQPNMKSAWYQRVQAARDKAALSHRFNCKQIHNGYKFEYGEFGVGISESIARLQIDMFKHALITLHCLP